MCEGKIFKLLKKINETKQLFQIWDGVVMTTIFSILMCECGSGMSGVWNCMYGESVGGILEKWMTRGVKSGKEGMEE